MLIESRRCGLALEFKEAKKHANLIDDPLRLASLFPDSGAAIPGSAPWIYWFKNGIEVEMRDIRSVHDHRNLQKSVRKPTQPTTASHNIIIYQVSHGFNKPRTVFDQEGLLHGYCETGSIKAYWYNVRSY